MIVDSPFVLWFTGLSASGKTTLSNAVKHFFESNNMFHFEILDGDEIRTNLSKGLSFSKEDRDTNIRRVGWVAHKLHKHGVNVLVSVISPYENIRNEVREMIGKGFIEIYMNCPIEECEKRDPKELYKKARAGILKGFTGVDDPYEAPSNPEISINSSEMNVSKEVEKIINFLEVNKYISMNHR